MLSFLHELQWWHWLIAAAVLIALETALTGAIAIWWGIAALIVGLLMLVVPLPWPLQLGLFGGLGLAALMLWRRMRKPESPVSSQAPLNQRGVHYVGQTFTLIEPIRGGSGKVQVGDTVWLVHGAEAPVGALVRVTGVDGAILRVETT